MKLKTRERYSLRMMMSIAKLSSEVSPVGLREVSEQCCISRRYLEQLVAPLKNASLLRAISGRGGGYTLARRAEEIKLGDIITAAIGPIAITECAVGSEECMHSDFCNCKSLWALINHKIMHVFYQYSLADLIDQKWPEKVSKEMNNSA
ncbi:MAG: Rrf2 family transcriptional regulator [Proteobacteria bacterium]|nr:Rrf2 family transcriptional regulator [Pseudomonadota bacterium]